MPQPQGQDPSKSRVPLYATLTVLGVLGGVAAIGYFAVVGWMKPPTPLVLGATGVLLPLVALNAVLSLLLSDRHEGIYTALRPAVLVSLLGGLVAVGVTASWFSLDVRKRALKQAAKNDLRSGVVGALEDPSSDIVARACVALFEVGIGGKRQSLLEMLDRRPAIARSCLHHASKGTHGEKAAEFGQVITERWHEELVSRGGSGERRRCRLARKLPEMPRAKQAGNPALLSCTLSAPTEAVRTCCGRTLEQKLGTGTSLADSLGNTIVRTVAEKLAAPLVQASLHQLQMEEKARARAVRLGLTKPEMKRYVAGFACAYTLNSGRTNEVTHQLAAWLDKRACSSEIPAVDQNINAWHRVCEHIALRIGDTETPADLICEAARADAISESIDLAKVRVESAFAGASHQFMQAQILAGVAMQQDSLRGPMKMLADSSATTKGGLLRHILGKMDRDREFRKKVRRLVVASSGMEREGLKGRVESREDLDLDEETEKDLEKMKERFRNSEAMEKIERFDRQNSDVRFDRENMTFHGLDRN